MRNPIALMFARRGIPVTAQLLGMDEVDDLRALCQLHDTLDARIEAPPVCLSKPICSCPEVLSCLS